MQPHQEACDWTASTGMPQSCTGLSCRMGCGGSESMWQAGKLEKPCLSQEGSVGGRTTQFARTIATLQGVVSGLYPGTPATTRILTARYSTPHWASHGAQLRDAWLRGIELKRWQQD